MLSGNTSGAVYHHLTAAHAIIQELQVSRAAFVIDRKLLSLSLEVYAYVSIVNCVTPYGFPDDRRMPLDMLSESVGCLSSHLMGGDMFTGCHRLFKLIPPVTHLAGQCLSEQRRLGDWNSDDNSLIALHDNIKRQIIGWKPPESLARNDAKCHQIRLAAEVTKHALMVYLSTAMLGATQPSAMVWTHIQSEIQAAFSLFGHISDTEILTILLWPLIILGSCMVHAEQQDLLIRGLTTNCFEMRHLYNICEVLQLLWNDPDPLAFGPYGLYMIMRKHGLHISIL